ncbi:hypothetical protein [Miniphocaeibacter massiliensis]|uniref:hypothetical protein n=1 Tax=Miniphocaeibacter massiliensis TaxID=2041841 RepID=UPI000C084A03|nr:hypothetical protein [Miniphocaeibacter massiliensis]
MNDDKNKDIQNTDEFVKISEEDLHRRVRHLEIKDEIKRKEEENKNKEIYSDENFKNKAGDERSKTIAIIAIIILVTVLIIVAMILVNSSLNKENDIIAVKETEATKATEELKEITTEKIETTEKAKEETKSTNPIINKTKPKVNQKAMTIDQVNEWVNTVLRYRENVYGWEFLKEEPYGTIMTPAKQSPDRLVYIEVRQDSSDGMHDNHVTTFRVNANGHLEEMDWVTGEYVVISTEYGEPGVVLN